MLGTFVGMYEGIRIFESARLGKGYNSGGIALPGYGIIVGLGVLSHGRDIALIQHEYGHILQARLTGWVRFYLMIGLPSLISAWTGWHGQPHQDYWTERWANQLSSSYFKWSATVTYRFPPGDISERSKWWLGISKAY